MSGKFMRVKRLLIPTLTMAIIASQLMGCAATSQSELLQMVNASKAIEIEIASPIYNEQGTQKSINWVQLDKLDTYSDFRAQLDDIMKITKYGQGSKSGIAYVDLEGKQEGNNTLYNAMRHRNFISSFIDNENVNLELQQKIGSVFVDAEEAEALIAAINVYWNLLPDSEPNYFNGGSTLSRLEAMSLVGRASNKVQEVDSQAFENITGESEFADTASLVEEYAFLQTNDKSLNTATANGSMTRAEYIYMVMNSVFGADEVNGTDISKVSFSDCKNAGNIAVKEKLNGDATSKDYFDNCILKFMLDNPDNGCDEQLFKAMASAQGFGIISSETRWDEAVTKTEAIQIYIDAVKAYNKHTGYSSDSSGDGSEVGERTESEESAESVYPEFTIKEMDALMMATKATDAYFKPSSDSDVTLKLQKDDVVHVAGQVVGANWFWIEKDLGGEAGVVCAFIDGQYLKEYVAPAEQTTAENQGNQNQENGNQGSQSQGNNQSQGNQNQGNNGGGNGGGGNQNQKPQQQQPPKQTGNNDDGGDGSYIREDGVLVLPDGTEVRSGDKGSGGGTVIISTTDRSAFK